MDLERLKKEVESQDWWTSDLEASLALAESVLEQMELINQARQLAYPASGSSTHARRGCTGNCRGCKGGSCSRESPDA